MSSSTITSILRKTVIIGQGNYGSPLTVASTGAVTPSSYGATGIVVPAGVAKAKITNDGHISGGGGGGSILAGGIGVDMATVASLINAGTVTGGGGGAYNYQAGAGGTAVNLRAGGSVTNTGSIVGGAGASTYGFNASAGGTGAALQGATTLNNAGTIAGGNGGLVSGYGGNYLHGGAGGDGVDLSGGGKATNTGTILGGQSVLASLSSTGNGGTGVALSASTFVNDGAITGGSAGYTPYGIAGVGGSGVIITMGGALTNAGTITGGNGGGTHYGSAGSGGTGVTIESGTLTNTGTIIGGAGASGYFGTASGGIGVEISGGGTLSTSGMIAGGSGAAAVSFGSGGGTLAIDPSAAFVGAVAANTSADVLELSSVKGGLTGTLTGALGTQFTGFANVAVAKGATWTLAGANALGSTSNVVDNGKLLVSGTLADAGQIGIGAKATLGVIGAGTAEVHSLSLSGGTLTGDATGAIALGATAGAAGAVTINANASLTGYGTIGGAAIVNDGTILVEGGTLTLTTGISGAASGTVQIESGAALVANSSVSGNQLTFGGPASLILVDSKAFADTIGSFGSGDVIDLQKVSANTLTYAGGTLTLEHGSTVIDTLTFSGNYTTADFSLASDGKGGTDISFTSTPTEHAAFGGWWQAHDPNALAVPLMSMLHIT